MADVDASITEGLTWSEVVTGAVGDRSASVTESLVFTEVATAATDRLVSVSEDLVLHEVQTVWPQILVTANLIFPQWVISGGAITSFTAEGDITFPEWEVEGTVVMGTVATSGYTDLYGVYHPLTFPNWTMAATGLHGHLATGNLTFPEEVSLSSTSYQTLAEAVANLVFPQWQISGTLSPYVSALVAALTTVLNAVTNGVTEYTNYSFNSFGEYGTGNFYGAKADGIYLLSGDDDNGTAIDVEVRKDKMDMGTFLEKRPLEMWINFECGGSVSLEVFADNKSQVYMLENGFPDMHSIRATIGKGLTGKFIGFKLKNLKGASLTLNEMELVTEVLSRRARNE